MKELTTIQKQVLEKYNLQNDKQKILHYRIWNSFTKKQLCYILEGLIIKHNGMLDFLEKCYQGFKKKNKKGD